MSKRRDYVPSMGEIDKIIDRKLQSSWGRNQRQREQENPSRLQLFQLIGHNSDRSPDWNAIDERCESNPHEVMQVDLRGRTSLALACAKDPPVATVRLLMRACRFGTEATRDKTGKTALHIAIQHNASLEAIRELCTSHKLVKTIDHQACTPLHIACQNTHCNDDRTHGLVHILIEAYADAVNQTDSKGRTPLEVAFESKASSKIVKLLRTLAK